MEHPAELSVYSFLAKAIYLMGYIDWIEVQEKGQLKPRFSKDTGIMQDTQIDNMAIKNKFLHPIEIIGKSE